jgi:thiamine-phosphate pyrophosphorylase
MSWQGRRGKKSVEMNIHPTLAELSGRLNSAPGGSGDYLPSAFLMSDPVRTPDLLSAAASLPPGAGVVLRHYEVPERAALAERLARVCRCRGVALLIGNDWRLAVSVGADGVHLAEAVLKRGVALPPALRRRWLVTAAAHSTAALFRAARFGADAAFLSPVFATASHPGAAGLGACRFAVMAHAAPLPVFALGGINRMSVRRLVGSGAKGVAAIAGLSPSGA